MKLSESRLVGLLIVVLAAVIPAAILRGIVDAKSVHLSRVILEAKWKGRVDAGSIVARAEKDAEEFHRRAMAQMSDDADRIWKQDIARRDHEYDQCEQSGGIPAMGFGLSVVCIKPSCIRELKGNDEQ